MLFVGIIQLARHSINVRPVKQVYKTQSIKNFHMVLHQLYYSIIIYPLPK